MGKKAFIEFKDVSKLYPGIVAVDKANFCVYPSEILGLVGENGAGKSTLVKLLTGAEKQELGDIIINGQKVYLKDSRHAMELGITAIYQELNIVPQLTVWENVFLGRELRTPRGFLDIPLMKKRAKELLSELGQDISPDTNIGGIGTGKQQMVEIAKALSINAKLIIMDEPTSSLSAREVNELFKTVRSLKEKGIAVIFISHRIEEILNICDRIIVLRDGKIITTKMNKNVEKDELIRLMVGRSLDQQYPKVVAALGEEFIHIEHFSSAGLFKDISFRVRKGEIVGLTGLVGAGRTEVARALFAADKKDSGDVYIKNKKVEIKTPKDAMSHGIAFLTEDRKMQGLVLINTVGFNINLATFETSRSGMLLNLKKLHEKSVQYIKRLGIKTPSENFLAMSLSGGNQQKVVIAKWLDLNADFFIFDEPTRGLDVGAKVEVYEIMNELVKNGKAILMISSEMPEILGMSDRILVMHEGHMMRELSRAEATQEEIMQAAAGGK